MTVPYLLTMKANYNYDVSIVSYDIKLSIYAIPYASVTFFSENIPVNDLLAMLNRENQIELVINGVVTIAMIPLQAEILADDVSIKLTMVGYIGDLYRSNGYYIKDGTGYIDYTRILDGMDEAIGVYAYDLVSDVLKHTHFGLRYAPAYDDRGNLLFDSRIFVRGDWLTRPAWVYTVAANTFFSDNPDYDPEDINSPEFVTDMTDSSAMVDCCNVITFPDNTITIGVAGCRHIYKNGLPTNYWKKNVVNITDYIVTKENTIFKFIDFKNAVVQGGSGTGNSRDTYVANPINVNYMEPFNFDFNMDKLNFFGSGSAVEEYTEDKWSIATDGQGHPNDPFLYMVSANTSDERKEEFAVIKGLWANIETGTTLSVDITSETDIAHNYFQDPEAPDHMHIYEPYSFVGAFMGYKNPEYDVVKNPIVKGYFFGLFKHVPTANTDGSPNFDSTKTAFMILRKMPVKHEESGDVYTNYTLEPVFYAIDDRLNKYDDTQVFNLKIYAERIDDGLKFTIEIRLRDHSEPIYSYRYYDMDDPINSEMVYFEGEMGVFSFANIIPELDSGLDKIANPMIAKFDNLKVVCTSETLFGDLDKPVIFNKNKALNNAVQGKIIAKSTLAQQNIKKEITVSVDPTTIFDIKLEPGMWVDINAPAEIAGQHRIVSITMTPSEIKLNLNRDYLRFNEYIAGIEENINIIDSFSAVTN